jgi:hypothetical protein
MNYKELLDRSVKFNIQDINRAAASIQADCEKYPDIKEFVELFLGDDKVASELQMLVYYITNWDMRPTTSDVVVNLESFISNYFLDDSYFSVFETDYCGKMIYKAKYDGDGTQKPRLLIDAARHNVEVYRKLTEEWQDELD